MDNQKDLALAPKHEADQDWHEWARRAGALWDLLDRISSLGDQLKPEHTDYVLAVEEIAEQRSQWLYSDGYALRPTAAPPPMPALLSAVKEGRLAAAVRESLLEVLSRPLTIASLHRISRICSGGTVLLEPEHPRKRSGGIVMGNSYDPEFVGAVGYDVPISQTVNGAENFGTQIIREAMALVAEWNKKKTEPTEPDAFSLTMAIQNAEKLGMPEVVEKLKDQLRAKYDCLPAAAETTAGAP